MIDKINEILKKPYRYLLTEEEGGGFSARVVEFSGCFAEGNALLEAVTNLEIAAKAWLEGMLENGVKIPEPVGNQLKNI